MSAVNDFNECEELYNDIREKAIERSLMAMLGKATASFDSRKLDRLRELSKSLNMGIELDELQSHCNGGRGVSCVRQVASELMRGSAPGARAIAHTDWDKIRNYPALTKWLQENKIADLDW